MIGKDHHLQSLMQATPEQDPERHQPSFENFDKILDVGPKSTPFC